MDGSYHPSSRDRSKNEIEKLRKYPNIYKKYFIDLNIRNWHRIRTRDPIPEKYIYPNKIIVICGGLLSAILGFLFVLIGFRGMTRGIKGVLSWIIDGFKKDESKE